MRFPYSVLTREPEGRQVRVPVTHERDLIPTAKWCIRQGCIVIGYYRSYQNYESYYPAKNLHNRERQGL